MSKSLKWIEAVLGLVVRYRVPAVSSLTVESSLALHYTDEVFGEVGKKDSLSCDACGNTNPAQSHCKKTWKLENIEKKVK